SAGSMFTRISSTCGRPNKDSSGDECPAAKLSESSCWRPPVESYQFHLLALDIGTESPIQTETQLLHSLLSNAKLWRAPKLHQVDRKITDGELELTATAVSGQPELEGVLNKAFLLRANGPFDALEPIRVPIAEHLQKQSFERLYVLKDQVS